MELRGRCDCLKMIMAAGSGRPRTPGHWYRLSPGVKKKYATDLPEEMAQFFITDPTFDVRAEKELAGSTKFRLSCLPHGGQRYGATPRMQLVIKVPKPT